MLSAIEDADVLVAASPVYKASYTGLFKHLFDLLDPKALEGRHVLLAATGGSDRHALVIEHQLRPLFAFFGAHILPISLYAVNGDFEGSDELAPSIGRVSAAPSTSSPRLRREVRRPATVRRPTASRSSSTSPEFSGRSASGRRGPPHAFGNRPCKRTIMTRLRKSLTLLASALLAAVAYQAPAWSDELTIGYQTAVDPSKLAQADGPTRRRPAGPSTGGNSIPAPT